MKELAPGLEIPETGCRLKQAVLQDSWGEIWRADHSHHGQVFLVLYTTEAGEAVFEEALPGLKRWKEVSNSGMVPNLLPILEIHEETAFPSVLVQDPGGRSLRELASEGPLDVRVIASIIVAVARGLLLARSYEIFSVALSPDMIIEHPGGQANWRLLPVAPNARQGALQIWNGRYEPPEIANSQYKLDELSPDVYGLSWMFVDLIAGNFSLRRSSAMIREYVPYPRLRTLIENGVAPRSGSYGDPKLTQIAVERWLKNEAAEDIRAFQAKQPGNKKGKAQQVMQGKGRLIGQILILVLLLGFLICAVAVIPGLFQTQNTVSTPYGLSNLFLEELVQRDAQGAQAYAEGEAEGQVPRILREIEQMEQQALASRFAEAVPQVHGDGATRTVQVDLKGENGDLFMTAEMTIQRQDNGEWRVEQLFYKSTREE